MRVIAFDIDGVLTESEGRKKFINLKDRQDIIVGIVSARSESSINQFLTQTKSNPMRTALEPDFKRSAKLKGFALRDLKDKYPDADGYTYHGSWARDRVHAGLSGWEYKQL